MHLLLTDVSMLGMGARALAEQMAAARSGMKVLYMSGYLFKSLKRVWAHPEPVLIAVAW